MKKQKSNTNIINRVIVYRKQFLRTRWPWVPATCLLCNVQRRPNKRSEADNTFWCFNNIHFQKKSNNEIATNVFASKQSCVSMQPWTEAAETEFQLVNKCWTIIVCRHLRCAPVVPRERYNQPVVVVICHTRHHSFTQTRSHRQTFLIVHSYYTIRATTHLKIS